MNHTKNWILHMLAMETAPPPDGDFYPVNYDFDIEAAKRATAKIDELIKGAK